MPFVGRATELAALEDWWNQPPGRAGLVWGRRRVGKTALLQHFSESRPTVFFTGARRARHGELEQFSRVVATSMPDSFRDLADRPFRSWDEAFDHLGNAAKKPTLLVIDEFPELLAGDGDVEGVLRAFLDRAAGRTELRILLCGSAVRTMQSIQEYRSPLYGRFELSLQLRPFSPPEASLLLPGATPAEQALIYGICGGMPLYLSWWRTAETVQQNLVRLATSPGSRMLTEGDLVLATEGAPSSHLGEVLGAIADGHTRHHEIADATGIDPTRALKELVDLRLVERLVPVTETAKSRRRIYRICDNFLLFYLGILGRYRSEIDRGLGQTVVPAIAAALNDHMGQVWEEMFRDYLRRNAAQIADDVVAIGQWWRADGQDELDAVALRGRGRQPVLVGEAKWGRSVRAGKIVATLAAKAAQLVDDVGTLRYAVCGREEVVGAPEDAWTITARDIIAPS